MGVKKCDALDENTHLCEMILLEVWRVVKLYVFCFVLGRHNEEGDRRRLKSIDQTLGLCGIRPRRQTRESKQENTDVHFVNHIMYICICMYMYNNMYVYIYIPHHIARYQC